jgi:hypothetical protein
MDEKHGGGEVALDLSQIREQGHDLRGDVFIASMKAHEGIEHEELWPNILERRPQPVSVALDVEPNNVGGDHVNIQRREINGRGASDTFDSTPDDIERVLCRK